MSQELVISSNPVETTVAIREDDRLIEIYVEHHAQKAIAGSIYKGRVKRVLPGMQSAFVDIGLKRDAFLYVTEVLDPAESLGGDLETEPIETEPLHAIAPAKQEPPSQGESKREEAAAAKRADGAPPASRRRRPRRRRRRSRRRKAVAAPSGNGQTASERASESGGGARSAPVALLPGESIAKYREHADEAPKQGRADADASVRAEAEAAAQSGGPDEPVADSSESEVGVPPAAEQGERHAESGSEPPRRRAEVSAPSLVAELRLRFLDRFRRKVEAPVETGSKRPATPPRPRRTSDSRPKQAKARPQSRPESGKRPRRGPRRRRSGRRPHRRARNAQPKRSAPQRQQKPSPPQANIKDLLRRGQEVIVQVTKEPVGSKGARITSHVSLPGRYMVYLTTAKHHGVARKIQPESERSRLRKLVNKHSAGKPGGFIVRTAAKGVSEEALTAEMDFLHQLWVSVRDKAANRKAPARLHSDLDIVDRVLRDHLGQSYKAIWVDAEDAYERIVRFLEGFQPELVPRVKLWTGRTPVSVKYGIANELNKALKPKVWLKSGGYLVIDQTEALVAVDVNTGRYVGKSDRLEDTVLKTNLEAAEEIVRQLQLRDLGGIIVIDFIDMEDRKNNKKVHQVLHDALRNTRSPSRLLPFNDFGLVVITRKAVRQSLERSLCMPCPACSGAGTVKSSATVLSEIFSEAGRLAAGKRGKNGRRKKELTLRVPPEVAKQLKRKSNSHLESLESTVGSTILVRSDQSLHPGRFNLS